MKPTSNIHLYASINDGNYEKAVSAFEHRGALYVATEGALYRKEKDKEEMVEVLFRNNVGELVSLKNLLSEEKTHE